MDFKADPVAQYARILAVFSLALGLGDAARLLGAANASYLMAFGASGLIVLIGLCLASLFAAVGLWMLSRWGAVLLAGALLVELALTLAGVRMFTFSLMPFVFKFVVLLATMLLLALGRILAQRHVHD